MESHILVSQSTVAQPRVTYRYPDGTVTDVPPSAAPARSYEDYSTPRYNPMEVQLNVYDQFLQNCYLAEVSSPKNEPLDILVEGVALETITGEDGGEAARNHDEAERIVKDISECARGITQVAQMPIMEGLSGVERIRELAALTAKPIEPYDPNDVYTDSYPPLFGNLHQLEGPRTIPDFVPEPSPEPINFMTPFEAFLAAVAAGQMPEEETREEVPEVKEAPKQEAKTPKAEPKKVEPKTPREKKEKEAAEKAAAEKAAAEEAAAKKAAEEAAAKKAAEEAAAKKAAAEKAEIEKKKKEEDAKKKAEAAEAQRKAQAAESARKQKEEAEAAERRKAEEEKKRQEEEAAKKKCCGCF